MPYEVIEQERKLMPALARGVMCKCPHCGKGGLFRAYLKTRDVCPVCGEELFHHRADDMPPYIAILIVGHVLVGLMLDLDMAWHIPPMTYLMWLLPIGIFLPVAILPSIKGGVVAMQWALRMHGFGGEEDGVPIESEDPPG